MYYLNSLYLHLRLELAYSIFKYGIKSPPDRIIAFNLDYQSLARIKFRFPDAQLINDFAVTPLSLYSSEYLSKFTWVRSREMPKLVANDKRLIDLQMQL